MGNNNSNIILNTSSLIWCMLNLNKITYQNTYLNLIAVGFANGKIIIFDLSKMSIHQEIKNNDKVYSLTQFKDDNKYLIFSLSNGMMKIYILKENKYEHLQTLEKPEDIKRGEINKVITLSDGNLATAERGAITIWKPIIKSGEKKFEFHKEIITEEDTCQLLEINPKIFACAIYENKLIKVFKKNDDNDYLLFWEISNAESHGNNSNGMARINENIRMKI